MKMYGYSRVRGSRSADLEDLNSLNGREQRMHAEMNPQQDSSMDPSAQAGFILGRALSLKESLKDKKLVKKISQPATETNNGTHSLQGAVKRVFSTRKGGADHDRLNPHSDEAGFRRSESMKYSRIASSAASMDLDGDGGGFAVKKKKSVLKTCKRLLGMQRN